MKDDGVDFLGILAVRRWRRFGELCLEPGENALVHDDHVLYDLGDGPAIRGGLKAPLRVREAFGGFEHGGCGIRGNIGGLGRVRWVRGLAFCFPS